MTQPDRLAEIAREGRAHFDAGRLEAAERCFLEAVAMAPDDDGVLHNLGVIRDRLGDLPGAEAWLRRAVSAAPGHSEHLAALGLVRLAQGEFAEGFRLYDSWRDTPGWSTDAAPALSIPRWRGETLIGKRVLVISEEGLGDQIMYARFVRLLQKRGAAVTWICPAVMDRVFKAGLQVDTILIGGEARVTADFYLSSSALPVAFMPLLGSPPAEPYLTPPPPRSIPGARIGVMARGNPRHWNDRHRSLPPELGVELMALPGAIGLEPQNTGAADLHDTAAIIAGLDLVISVDTAVAHLAGALGKPVWLLLPAIGTDWRWGREGAGSAWYPSARLFRQPAPGDWASLIAQVTALSPTASRG